MEHFKYMYTHAGFCRVHYKRKDEKKHLWLYYCIMDDGDSVQMYRCSKDGEPDYTVDISETKFEFEEPEDQYGKDLLQHYLDSFVVFNQVDELVIEVTRRCNLECEHCCRGDRENLDIDVEYIETMIKNISSIQSLIFTGGEPSMNIGAINKTLEICKKYNVYVNQIYIASNGFFLMKDDLFSEFMYTIFNWWVYCGEKEMMSVDISNSTFHEYEYGFFSKTPLETKNWLSIRDIPFINMKYSENKKDEYEIVDWNKVIPTGRAKFYGGNIHPYQHCEMEDGAIRGTFYLSADGTIMSDCDWSYEEMNKDNEFYLGHITNLAEVINTIKSRMKEEEME